MLIICHWLMTYLIGYRNRALVGQMQPLQAIYQGAQF
jgi:hypothetical protein